MHRHLGATILAFGIALAPFAAVAAAPSAAAPGSACKVATPPTPPGIQFMLKIQPTDGILDVWCRIQALQGKHRVNVLFPETKAHRTFEATFDGTPSRPREELARFIQSLIPTASEGPAQDEAGMPFPAVLQKTYQALAPRTPDNQALGLPLAYPGSRALALWEPVVLRIRPLVIAEREFVLSITLRPQVGRLLMALQGTAEQFILRAAKSRVIPYTGNGRCPEDRIPDCEKLPEVVEVQTAWVVSSVKLTAEGGGLSPATQALFGSLIKEGGTFVRTNNMRKFSVTDGSADFEIQDEAREVLGQAIGDPSKVAGTNSISVEWRERRNSNVTASKVMADFTKATREQYVLQYVTPKAK